MEASYLNNILRPMSLTDNAGISGPGAAMGVCSPSQLKQAI